MKISLLEGSGCTVWIRGRSGSAPLHPRQKSVLLFSLLSQETGQGKLKEEGSCFDSWFERT